MSASGRFRTDGGGPAVELVTLGAEFARHGAQSSGNELVDRAFELVLDGPEGLAEVLGFVCVVGGILADRLSAATGEPVEDILQDVALHVRRDS